MDAIILNWTETEDFKVKKYEHDREKSSPPCEAQQWLISTLLRIQARYDPLIVKVKAASHVCSVIFKASVLRLRNNS